MVEVKIGVPDGITREDVEKAIRDYDAGVEHGFGPSSTYDLVYEGNDTPRRLSSGWQRGESRVEFLAIRIPPAARGVSHSKYSTFLAWNSAKTCKWR